jgi:hypothetical protein
MWGSWYGILFGGLLVVLLLVGVAFGTSALLFPLVMAPRSACSRSYLCWARSGSAPTRRRTRWLTPPRRTARAPSPPVRRT